MENEFEYTITAKNKVVIMTFKGRISKGAKPIIEKCRLEFSQLEASCAVIYFKDVDTIHPVAFRELTCLQKDIREKELPLRIVGLSYENKQYLLEQAVIRLNETKKDIEEALHSIAKVVA